MYQIVVYWAWLNTPQGRIYQARIKIEGPMASEDDQLVIFQEFEWNAFSQRYSDLSVARQALTEKEPE